VGRRATVLAIAVVTATAAVALRGLAAPPASPPSPGHALYATHCAVCHGESGLGDGPSAAGFASKPSNLTDGRRLNQLPEEFFTNIVLNGGPAEGLSPGMPPFQGHLNEGQIRQIVAYLRTRADPPFKDDDPRPIVTTPGLPASPSSSAT
jgi:high-affinity iron transporter